MYRPSSLSVCSIVAIGVGIASATPSAHAVPVDYNETASGDLSATDPLTVFTLGHGINTIVGSFGINAIDVIDLDSFAFIVPQNTSVVLGNITSQGNLPEWSWQLRSGDTSVAGSASLATFEFPHAGGQMLPALGSGDYVLQQTGITPGMSVPEVGFYTVTMTDVVPEPASIGLLAAGAGMLLCRRRREVV